MPVRKWGEEQRVNTTVTGDQTSAAVTVLNNGNFVSVWQDGSGSVAVLRGQMFDTTGQPIGREFLVDKTTIGDTLPTIAPLANGGFIVSYQHYASPENQDLYVSVFDAAGVYQNRIVSTSFSHQFSPDVAQLGNGAESILVWEDLGSNNGDIRAAAYAADGTLKPSFVVNSVVEGEQSHAAITAGPLSILPVAVWSSGNSIKGSLLGPDGIIGSEFQVNVPTGDIPMEPDVAYIGAGRFVVTWTSFNQGSGGGIHARLFGVYGGIAHPIASEIFVNATTEGGDSTITPLHNGGFVVSWSESNFFGAGTGPDTSGSSIHLQAFDGSGAKMGGETIVNTTTTNSQLNPSVTALMDDRVVVTWTDYSGTGGDASGTSIKMQIVDPRDGLIFGAGGDDVLYGHDFVNDEMNGGDGNDKLYGLDGADALYGGDNNDRLDGGHGADMMVGGTGNDTYFVDTIDDRIIERNETGTDTVYSSVTYSLAGQYAERLYLTGSAAINATGNSLNNVLNGNTGANKLVGGDGADTLNGGLGKDSLFGGTGNDSFAFSTKLSSANVDVINDFANVSGNNDTIRLDNAIFTALIKTGTLATALFAANTTGTATQSDDRIVYETDTGNLYYDHDGSGGDAGILFAVLKAHPALTASDFVVF
ncbi:calcium-binding protein [Methylobacterium sp. 77]|uniref:calcium-binding protein n=1 Tax=Methylobacterium sp. 77 TaxID=1101192 RepID=UPI0003739F3B|nr:calcium-binding protein [Methylobacterium sp. 77]